MVMAWCFVKTFQLRLTIQHTCLHSLIDISLISVSVKSQLKARATKYEVNSSGCDTNWNDLHQLLAIIMQFLHFWRYLDGMVQLPKSMPNIAEGLCATPSSELTEDIEILWVAKHAWPPMLYRVHAWIWVLCQIDGCSLSNKDGAVIFLDRCQRVVLPFRKWRLITGTSPFSHQLGIR